MILFDEIIRSFIQNKRNDFSNIVKTNQFFFIQFFILKAMSHQVLIEKTIGVIYKFYFFIEKSSSAINHNISSDSIKHSNEVVWPLCK